MDDKGIGESIFRSHRFSPRVYRITFDSIAIDKKSFCRALKLFKYSLFLFGLIYNGREIIERDKITGFEH